MPNIEKSDIVGARIIDIHETYELLDGWLDSTQTYFTVDRGFTFVAPSAGYCWSEVELPERAERLGYERITREWDFSGWLPRLRSIKQSSIVKQIMLRRISGVYCGAFDEELEVHCPPEGRIVFDDGSQAFSNMVAPQGVGGTGLRYFLADSGQCTPLEQMVDYFSISLYTPAWRFKRVFANLSIGIPNYLTFTGFTEPKDTVKGGGCTADFIQSEMQFAAFITSLGVSQPSVLSSTGGWVTANSKLDPKRPWRLLVHADSTNTSEKIYRVHIEGHQPGN